MAQEQAQGMTGANQLTREQVQQMIAARLDSAAGQQARDLYISQKMQDLPEVFRSLLPSTTDQGQLAKAEQTIRTQYQQTMRTEVPKHVAKGHYVGSDPPQNVLDYQAKVNAAEQALASGNIALAQQLLNEAQAQPAAQQPAPDLSKMSATEKILYGLQNERAPVRAGAGDGGGAGANDLTAQQAAQRVSLSSMSQRAAMGNMSSTEKIAMGLRQGQ